MSRPVKQLFSKGEFSAQVLGIFDHACDLVTPAGEVVAVVVPEIGNGPFNIVIDDNPIFFSELAAHTPVILTENQLQLGEFQIDLRGADVWEPQPDWDTLRSRQATIISRIPFLETVCHRHAPANTFLKLLKESQPNEEIVLSTARNAGDVLLNGWTGNQDQLHLASKMLAGLGPGLTPAGDDFLCGVMLWAWLVHPDPVAFCHPLLHTAAPRTITLSAAFLQTAANGECGAPWHSLLPALSVKTKTDIEIAAQKVLAHGATSGADTLAGFLYLPTFTSPHPPQPSPNTPFRR
jgi:hypothetical protein